tara:strand:+ start:1479 stop:2114 length:636 start_codon:yes stop_codon:yes gene_type:complete
MKVILIIFTLIIFLIFYSFKNKEKFQNLNLIKTNIKSPYKYNFYIYIDKRNNIIYKKVNEIKINDIDNYKNTIYNLKNIKIINNYLYYPNNIYIENDGSYYSIYMKDNVSIYNVIEKNKKICYKTKIKIINNLDKLKKDLILFNKNNELIGDWNPSNLLYDYETNKIYNIDYEGFARNLYFKMLSHYFPFIYLDINNYFNMLIKKIRDTPV